MLAVVSSFDMFCERCGTRYGPPEPSSESLPLGRRIMVALGRKGDESAPKPDEPVLRFCLACRGYNCPNCWNDEAGFCQGCVPLPEPPPQPVQEPVFAEHEHVWADTTPLAPQVAEAPAAEPWTWEPTPAEVAPEAPAEVYAFGEAAAPAAAPVEDLTPAEAVVPGEGTAADVPGFAAVPGFAEQTTPSPRLPGLEIYDPGLWADDQSSVADSSYQSVSEAVEDEAPTEVVETPADQISWLEAAAEQTPSDWAVDGGAEPVDEMAAETVAEPEPEPEPELELPVAAFEGVAYDLDDEVETEPEAMDSVEPGAERMVDTWSVVDVEAAAEAEPVVDIEAAVDVPSVFEADNAVLAEAVVEEEPTAEPEPQPEWFVSLEPEWYVTLEPEELFSFESDSAAEPEMVAEPVTAEPEPVFAEPEPMAAEPEPVFAEPEPVFAEPQPVAAEPEAEPEPVFAEPEPVFAEPEPVAVEPEPVAEPVQVEPTFVPEAPVAPVPPAPAFEQPQMPAFAAPPTFEPQPPAQAPARPVYTPLAPIGPILPPMRPPAELPASPRIAFDPNTAPPAFLIAQDRPMSAQPVAPQFPAGLFDTPPPPIRPCHKCQLPLSARAHFCRRCGSPQQ